MVVDTNSISGLEGLKDSQFLSTTNKPCLAARYANLWHIVHKERQLDNNIDFYIYKEVIRESIQKTPRILPQVVEAYKPVVQFKARVPSHVYSSEEGPKSGMVSHTI
jgi:hypothetical protein